MLPRKLSSCSPFWDLLSAFISPLSQHRAAALRQLQWEKEVAPSAGAYQSAVVTALEERKGYPASLPRAQTVHNTHFRDAPICNALLSQVVFFFFFLMSKYEAILRSIHLKLVGKGK